MNGSIMQNVNRLTLCAALVAAVGCGGSDNDADTGARTDTGTAQDSATDTGGSQDSGTADATTTDSETGDSGSSDSGSSDSGTADVTSTATFNGCADSDYRDMTGMSNVAIAFGGAAGLTYSPKCLHVSTGTAVTFNGSFSAHPLVPGAAPSIAGSGAGTTPTPIAMTSTGTTAIFTFPTAGDYPYYCNFHQGVGMVGSIRVQ